MNVREAEICRLCLKAAGKGFEVIDEITKEMFEVLLLRMNLDVSKDPIVCKDCIETAIKCFNFKSICIDTEEIIISFTVNRNATRFQLQEVFKGAKETVDDNFMCRFCFNHLSGNNVVLLDTLRNDGMFAEMLQALMSEMDFDVIKYPRTCTSCRQGLERYFEFVENCWNVEALITEYCRNERTRFPAQVKLSEIRQFSFKNIADLDCTQMKAIEQEEKSLDVKQHGVNIISEAAIFKCAMCPFQTKHKDSLKRHMSVHKDITQVETYECPTCTYKTKHKHNLKTHILIHKAITEVKMYECSVCAFQTKHKVSLKFHMFVHNDVTQAEMHKCSICMFQVTRKGGLKRHMLTHNNVTQAETYKCSMCTYESNYKANLTRHILRHKTIAEVETYKCSMCMFRSKHKPNLERHKLTHRDIKWLEMYRCSMCTFKTKHKGNLGTHIKKHK